MTSITKSTMIDIEMIIFLIAITSGFQVDSISSCTSDLVSEFLEFAI